MQNHITAGQLGHVISGAVNDGINLDSLRRYRYARVQDQLRANDCAAVLLNDPINIRYATDTRNMSVWLLHNPGRYCLVPAIGKAILFDYPNRNCLTNAPQTPEIAEVRLATAYGYQYVAEHADPVCRQWAAEIRATVAELMGPGSNRLAIDRADLEGVDALRAQGFQQVEGQRLLEVARSIKSAEEIECMRQSLAVADIGMQRMRDALRPGLTEIQLWAELHHANIAHGGEWIETRLLSSGTRTNPWFQEASARVINDGDLVSFDTDMVGPFGYCSDVSRTFHCGNSAPTSEQRSLYALAVEQVEFNCALLQPGLGFREFIERSWPIPARFNDQNYGCIAHGVGMVDEWPGIGCDAKEPTQMDGVFAPGMTVCIESYIGEVGCTQGVKMEQQVLITETGHEVLSLFPLESGLR
jgi:Xaa-Pro aminopeptidase